MISAELVKRVEDKILETLLKAQEIFRRPFEVPSLSFDLDSGKVAGRAYYSFYSIKINPRFLREFPDEVLGNTVGHEVAHLLCHKMFPHAKQAHGPEWRSIMRALGLSESRCHSMSLDIDKKFRYSCGCRIYYVTPIIHKRIMAGNDRFCRECKNKVFLAPQ